MKVLHKMSSKTPWLGFFNSRYRRETCASTGRISAGNSGPSIWNEKPAGVWGTVGAQLEDKRNLSL